MNFTSWQVSKTYLSLDWLIAFFDLLYEFKIIDNTQLHIQENLVMDLDDEVAKNSLSNIPEWLYD